MYVCTHTAFVTLGYASLADYRKAGYSVCEMMHIYDYIYIYMYIYISYVFYVYMHVDTYV